MRNQQIVKVNDSNSISILTSENGQFEMAHLVNGEISYKYRNDVVTLSSTEYMEKEVADIVSEIVADFFDGQIECDEQAYMEMFTYTVWVAVTFYDGKLVYDCSTVHQENYEKDKDNQLDLNRAERKTWKGLMNYVNRFDV